MLIRWLNDDQRVEQAGALLIALGHAGFSKQLGWRADEE